MLVLSRKVGETIVLPSLNLIITVTAVTGQQVRLGITAAPEVRIRRAEVQQHPGKPEAAR
jgi:carbon storage regulator CsrA